MNRYIMIICHVLFAIFSLLTGIPALFLTGYMSIPAVLSVAVGVPALIVYAACLYRYAKSDDTNALNGAHASALVIVSVVICAVFAVVCLHIPRDWSVAVTPELPP
jgi:hypothetical protein